MELSSSWEAASCAVTEEFPNILWNSKVSYHVHKSHPLVPTLSQISPLHTTSSYLRSSLILSTHLSLCLPDGVFPPSFSTKNPICILLIPRSFYMPVYLILFDLVLLIILGKEYKLWSSLSFLIQAKIEEDKSSLPAQLIVAEAFSNFRLS
jgi:hypothetical protein